MTADQLRKSILQQAIQGKLVSQDPNDEPASVLLECIREEKARLVKEKKIKEEKNPSIIFRGEDNSYYEKIGNEIKCIDEEIPFDLPKGWNFCRLSVLCWLDNGAKHFGEVLPYLDVKYQRGYSLPNYVKEGRLVESQSKVILVDGENSGEVFTTRERGYLGSTFKVLRFLQQISATWLQYILDNYRPLLKGSKVGAAIPHLNKKLFHNLIVGLPPQKEQQRIVAKIEELTPLVKQYGKAQRELEALNSKIREQLKKSVLQYAIEGKLVPQCEEDGTAEDLLREIQAEKQRLYAEGKIKKKDLAHSSIFRGADNKYYEKIGNEIICIDEEIPFEIPKGWEWCRLGGIANMYTGNSINKETKEALYTNVDGLPYIATKDVGFDKNIVYSNGVAIPYSAVAEFRVAPASTVLVCIEGGSAGRKIGVLNQDVCFGNKLCCIHPYKDFTHYIYHYLQSFTFLYLFSENKNGIIGGVSLKGLKNLLLPLPPSAEIRKINNKLSQMLSIIEGI